MGSMFKVQRYRILEPQTKALALNRTLNFEPQVWCAPPGSLLKRSLQDDEVYALAPVEQARVFPENG
jgi:hypothetical protein